MKTRLLILGLCCTFAAISCTSIDDSASAPKPVTITLSKDDISTKTTLTEKTEGGLSRVWAEGDAVSVIYIKDYDVPGGGINDKFVLTSGAGTTTGTFTCASSSIPMTGEVYVRIVYPYAETNELFDRCDYSLANQSAGKLSDLGKYDLIMGRGKFTDGVFSITENLSNLVLFFRIPAGTKLFNTTETVSIKTLTLSAAEDNFIKNSISVFTNNNQNSTDKGSISLQSITGLTNGTLPSDVFIALATDSKSSFKFKLSITTSAPIPDKEYTFLFERNDYLSYGKVYTLKQSLFTPQDI